jgi:hypothetical protein
MSKNAQIPSAERVTPFAEIQKLTLVQTVERFAASIRTSSSMFMLAAKMILHITATVKAPQSVGGLLRKSGIRKTTIDNARQAARVFEELVLQAYINEAQFDRLTLAECVVINQAMSGKAKEKQSGRKIAALMKSKPNTWDEELDCLFRYGHSAAKQREIEKQAAAEAAKAEKIAAIDHNRPSETLEAKTPGKSGKTGKAGGATAAASNVVQSGIRKDATKCTADDALELIASLNEMFNELTPIEAAKALPALTELHTNVAAFVGTIKAAASPQRTRHVVASRQGGRKIVKLPQGRKAKSPPKKAA